MTSTMAIVLPSRKKKSDIFAPSKAIQDAKEKIGPAYFDISLLECSRNAVELTKLISKWEELEKEKLKIIRDINREEDILVRLIKARKPNGRGQKKTPDHLAAAEGTETLDGKTITPGFRFRSNGDLKPSTIALPLVGINDAKDDKSSDISEKSSNKSRIIDVGKNYKPTGNYEQEISELEAVIRDLHNDLAKFKLSSDKFPSTEKFHTYLRAHRNTFVSMNEFTNTHFSNSANDRFAFKPGSSDKVHSTRIKTPTFRSCTGCKFKLRCNVDDKKLKKTQSEDLGGKRRWSYVPHGKYVQSTCSIFPKESNTQAAEQYYGNKQSETMVKSRTKSTVKFQTSKEAIASKAISQVSANPSRTCDDMMSSCKNSPSLSSHCKKSVSSISNRGRSMSAVSGLSGISCTRIPSNLLMDHEPRFQRLKRLQEEEQQHCDFKVRAFLNKLSSSSTGTA